MIAKLKKDKVAVDGGRTAAATSRRSGSVSIAASLLVAKLSGPRGERKRRAPRCIYAIGERQRASGRWQQSDRIISTAKVPMMRPAVPAKVRKQCGESVTDGATRKPSPTARAALSRGARRVTSDIPVVQLGSLGDEATGSSR